MRPNNRQRSRGGRNGGGGGGHHHKQHHNHNPNRPPNRNQIFDSSGPDVRVRGNAHQVFDKYQALAREAASSGDRIMAEAYWQYADHYFRMIQSMGGFVQRNNQGWGEGGEEGQQGNPQQQQGQPPNPQQANGSGYAQGENRQGGGQGEHRQGGRGEEQGGGAGEPGLGGVAFLQNGRGGAPSNQDPAADDQPEVPEFTPPTGRRGERG
jgi:Domain of unknown function (DUF4167)